MDPILTGGQGQPQQPGASAQTARQGQSAGGARSVDATMTAVNNGLQGLTAAMNAAATQAVAMTKQYNINASAHQKAAYSWTGSLRDLAQSATQFNKVLDLTIDTAEESNKANKEGTEQRKKLTKEEKEAAKAQKESTKTQKEVQKLLDAEAAARKKQLDEETIKKRIETMNGAKLSVVLRESRELLARRNALEQDLQKNEQELLAARTKKEVEALTQKRNAIKDDIAQNVTLYGHSREALKKHTGGILSVSDAMSKLKGRLNDFATGLAFGAAARKLYDEAQFAKTTGNYSSMGMGEGGFARGQIDAGVLGVGTQAYNEIMANARAAQITTSSLDEFNQNLMRGTDTLQTLTGSREEGARLAGELYKQGATVGITMSQMGSQVDVLGQTFGHLSKLTGKTAAEMAQLSVAIMNDATHREVLVGLQGEERAQYVKKRMYDLEQLKLQGYSIEQAEELQKKAIQARERGIADSVSGDAKARMQANVIAQAIGGQKGAQIAQTQAQINALTQKKYSGVLTGEEVQENAKQIQLLENSITQQVAEAKKGGMSFIQRGIVNEWEKKRQAQTDSKATDVAVETGSTEEQKRAKMLEGNIGGKGSPLDKATTAVGYVDAISNNTLALNALTGVMVGLRALDLGKAAWQNRDMLKGKIGGVGGAGSAGAVGKLAGRIGGLGLAGTIAGAGVDMAAGKLEEGGHTKSAAAMGVLGDAAQFATYGALLGPMGALAGGTLGAGYGLYKNWGKLTASDPSNVSKFDKPSEQQKTESPTKEATPPERAKNEREKETLEDLQKQYYKAALDFFKDSDPKMDAATRAKQADAMRRLAANANLAGASFSAAPATGG